MDKQNTIDSEHLRKLKILADLEAELYADSDRMFLENQVEYRYALSQWKREKTKEKIKECIKPLPNGFGKKLFQLYKEFETLIHSDHEKLQDIKQLFSDSIDFNGLELDRYAEGCDLGGCQKLYLRATPEEEIKEMVDSGPEILKQIRVQFSERGIWEAYLLYAAQDWIWLYWHANYMANDIVCPDCWKPILPPWWHDKDVTELPYPELLDGYEIPYPTVAIVGESAYIHYLCHYQHSNCYQDVYVSVEKDGDSLSFERFVEPNDSIKAVEVGNVLY